MEGNATPELLHFSAHYPHKPGCQPLYGFGPMKYEPFALSLSKGFDKLSPNPQADSRFALRAETTE